MFEMIENMKGMSEQMFQILKSIKKDSSLNYNKLLFLMSLHKENTFNNIIRTMFVSGYILE